MGVPGMVPSHTEPSPHSCSPAGAGRPEACAWQAEETVPGEGSRVDTCQPAGGAARGRGEEAAAAGGGAQEGAGPG